MNPISQDLTLEDLLSTRVIDRYRTSSDASHFRLIPRSVATPTNAEQVANLFAYASTNKTSVTFRSGGTSLSGQAVSDAILIDTRRHFRKIEVLNEGSQVKVQPGATVRAVNAALARFGRKLGPDPASEIACTIGGVIANNSSGMACGITDNTYRTLQSATVVLPNGSVINTADPDSDSQLKNAAPALYAELKAIKAEIGSQHHLSENIVKQYKIKNTMGYGLNSFVDFDSIIEIFLHLLVGSEGTLGFVAEAIFDTIPLFSKTATSLLIFEELDSAVATLDLLMKTNPATIELMDAASLRAGKFDLEGVLLLEPAALLIEYQAADDVSLASIVNLAQNVISTLPVVNDPQLSTDPAIQKSFWHIRKGLYAAVAGARRSGTTALLEDIAVPVNELAQTCVALQILFKKHEYEDAVIFGHAKDGNIHFLINEDFRDAKGTARFQAFTEDMVTIILAKGGSLKAEHGTGRMMAPFVERQFGSELYQIMVRIKSAYDPFAILNPDVLISSNALSHLQNIKINLPITKLADNCVECGYCEPICPSKDLTTTPRQRIVLTRALATAQRVKDKNLIDTLKSESQYGIEETCAVDGLCETACPVGINTGSLVKELRSSRASELKNTMWTIASDHWSSATNAIASVLKLSRRIPATFIKPINEGMRTILGNEHIPLWSRDLPTGGKPRTPSIHNAPDFVLFASCLGSVFDSDSADSFKSLSHKAGLEFTTPPQIADLCCGTPWASKGLKSGYTNMVDKTYKALLKSSENGRLPIVCENSSCSEGLIKAVKAKAGQSLEIIDAIDFTVNRLLPTLTVHNQLESVVLHPTCSSTLLGSNANLEQLAHTISRAVTIPADWGCCAYAGDRGMLHPELTASATAAEVFSIASQKFDAYLSTNSTCEIGMSQATGQKYQHVLTVLNQLASSRQII